MSVQAIAREIGVSRQAVYPMLAEACDAGLIRLNPPKTLERSNQIAQKYGLRTSDITVVGVTDRNMGVYVAHAAAEHVLELIEGIKPNPSRPVGLGLGPGGATLDFSRHLAHLLPIRVGPPQLNLFAISAGGPAEQPEVSPSSFFNLFPRESVAGCVGLFAENLVDSGQLPGVLRRPGVTEGYQKKEQIDIIVSALGDFDDEHDLLRTFLEKAGVGQNAVKEFGWIGNVQYRPFTISGPVKENPDTPRAVTLFELDEFVDIARTKDRHVVLIARQCRRCGHTHANAIRTLLRVKALKVWSHIVMDLATADALLHDK